MFGYGGSYKQGSIGIGDEPKSGFALGAGFGYQFFRTSNVGLEILVHGSAILNANSSGNPIMYGLRVGFYF